jgi:hypothetical protein
VKAIAILAALLLGCLLTTAVNADCPNGYHDDRSNIDKCVPDGFDGCYASNISCRTTGGGCCFNSHNPPPWAQKTNGHFCCDKGSVCDFSEGPDRGFCRDLNGEDTGNENNNSTTPDGD